MGAKISLAALRDDPSVAKPVARPHDVQTHQGAQPEPPQVGAELRKSVTSRVGADERIYTDYVRKEARLRDDQLDGLSTLARRLNVRRLPANRRITENTLIRIAVDMLLDKQDALAGQTEAELRHSITARR